MPKTPATATPAVALPALDAIESVEASAMPESVKRAALTADEIALAEKVIAAAQDGKYARGPKLADKAAATAAVARVRRLLGAYWKSKGTVKAETPSVTTRIVPDDGGSRWALTLGAPKPPKTDDAATSAPDADAGAPDAAANVVAAS